MILGLFPFQWTNKVILAPDSEGIQVRADANRLEFKVCQNKLEVKAGANRLEFRKR